MPTDYKQEQIELKAKLDIMSMLQCSFDDVNWLGDFLKNFGIPVQALQMFGSTFNDIVKGIYSEALKRAGLSTNDACVKIKLDMAKSTLQINDTLIHTLADLRQAALGLADPALSPLSNGITLDDIANVVDKKISAVKEELIQHVNSKFSGK